MLYKRKAIVRKNIKLVRIYKYKKCNNFIYIANLYCLYCPITATPSCLYACYKLSNYNGNYKQYSKHKLRYIGII